MKLNVGGTHFDISLQVAMRLTTLRGMMCEEASPHLYQVSDPVHEDKSAVGDKELDELAITIPTERIFIDRCPRTFCRLLGAVRNGIVARAPLDPAKIKFVVAEFDWWGYPWTASGIENMITVLSDPTTGPKSSVPTCKLLHADYILSKLPRTHYDQIVIAEQDVKVGPPETVFVTIDNVMREIPYQDAIMFRSLRRVLLPDASQADINTCNVDGTSTGLYTGIELADLLKLVPKRKDIERLAMSKFTKWSWYKANIQLEVKRIAVFNPFPRIKWANDDPLADVNRVMDEIESIGYPWTLTCDRGVSMCIDSPDGWSALRDADKKFQVAGRRPDQWLAFTPERHDPEPGYVEQFRRHVLGGKFNGY